MQIKADTLSIKPTMPTAATRAADGDYKTKGPGHEIKDADGDYKPQQVKPTTSAAASMSSAVLDVLTNLKRGG